MRPLAASGLARARIGWLAAGLLLLIAVVTVAATQIGGGDAVARYRDYFNRLRGPASDSQTLGRQVERLFGGRSLNQLAAGLAAAATREELLAVRVTALRPPPRLRTEHLQAVTALLLRTNGLLGLADVVRRAAATSNPVAGQWPSLLAAEGSRLVASDVIWQDSFLGATDAQLRHEGITGLDVPRSTFLRSSDLVTISAMANTLKGTAGLAVRLLKLGRSGPDVLAWQRALNRWRSAQPGLGPIAVTGIFDSETAAATRALQQSSQLTPDGVVGPATRAVLASG